MEPLTLTTPFSFESKAKENALTTKWMSLCTGLFNLDQKPYAVTVISEEDRQLIYRPTTPVARSPLAHFLITAAKVVMLVTLILPFIAGISLYCYHRYFKFHPEQTQPISPPRPSSPDKLDIETVSPSSPPFLTSEPPAVSPPENQSSRPRAISPISLPPVSDESPPISRLSPAFENPACATPPLTIAVATSSGESSPVSDNQSNSPSIEGEISQILGTTITIASETNSETSSPISNNSSSSEPETPQKVSDIAARVLPPPECEGDHKMQVENEWLGVNDQTLEASPVPISTAKPNTPEYWEPFLKNPLMQVNGLSKEQIQIFVQCGQFLLSEIAQGKDLQWVDFHLKDQNKEQTPVTSSSIIDFLGNLQASSPVTPQLNGEKIATSLIWALMLAATHKYQPFREGSFMLEDSENRLLKFFQRLPNTYQRPTLCPSSHLKGHAPLIQHGFDVTGYSLALPSYKSHLLLFSILRDGKTYLFLKPEEKGTNDIISLIAHAYHYVYKQLVPIRAFDDRKERIPQDLVNEFNRVVNLPSDSTVIKKVGKHNRGEGISAMYDYLKSLVDPSPEAQAFTTKLETLYDYLKVRIGEEVIFSIEEWSSATYLKALMPSQANF